MTADLTHTHRWIDGELLLNGCALPHAARPSDDLTGLDVERLARAHMLARGATTYDPDTPEFWASVVRQYDRLSRAALANTKEPDGG